MASPFVLADQVNAWSCLPVGSSIEISGDNAPTEEEILRQRSEGIAEYLHNSLRGGGVAVVGRFSRNVAVPFLHEDQLEGIRALYWPPAEDIQMPYRIEYTYTGAYTFVGHELIDAVLVPFSADVIDARVSISAEYEGIVDALPTTEFDVIGVLNTGSLNTGSRLGTFELQASPCPSYFEIEPVQLTDLLECYADGSCQ
jgi:hypothetical protein